MGPYYELTGQVPGYGQVLSKSCPPSSLHLLERAGVGKRVGLKKVLKTKRLRVPKETSQLSILFPSWSGLALREETGLGLLRALG